jgi:hypothetical protein
LLDQGPEVGLDLRGQLGQPVHAPLLWQWLVTDFGSCRDRDIMNQNAQRFFAVRVACQSQ